MINEKPMKTRLKNRVNTVSKMDTKVSNDTNSLLDFKNNPEFQHKKPVVINAWREDDLDSGETISKGKIVFEIASQNGQTIQSRTKEFTGLSLKDVNNQMEEFLKFRMKSTEYDC